MAAAQPGKAPRTYCTACEALIAGGRGKGYNVEELRDVLRRGALYEIGVCVPPAFTCPTWAPEQRTAGGGSGPAARVARRSDSPGAGDSSGASFDRALAAERDGGGGQGLTWERPGR